MIERITLRMPMQLSEAIDEYYRRIRDTLPTGVTFSKNKFICEAIVEALRTRGIEVGESLDEDNGEESLS